MDTERYNRQIRLFGKEGQQKLNNSIVSIVGVGGIGSHVAQQLSYLGVGGINLVDMDVLEFSNKNRLIGSFDKHQEGKPKTDIVEELIHLISPQIKVRRVIDSISSESAIQLVAKSDFVFGCFDNDGPRAFMNELVQAYRIPCLDLATGIHVKSMDYGGRLIFIDESGCLMCLNELDQSEIREYNETTEHKVDRQEIYGVDRSELNDSGPSVVSINGVVASLAVTEFILFITGIREPIKYQIYDGKMGMVRHNTSKPESGCYFCNTVRGSATDSW